MISRPLLLRLSGRHRVGGSIAAIRARQIITVGVTAHIVVNFRFEALQDGRHTVPEINRGDVWRSHDRCVFAAIDGSKRLLFQAMIKTPEREQDYCPEGAQTDRPE